MIIPIVNHTTDKVRARNDFLGRAHNGQTLKSFGINPGGHIGFFDPVLGDHDTFSIKADAGALMRLAVKSQKEARRSVRYLTFDAREKVDRIARRSARRAGRKGLRPALASTTSPLKKGETNAAGARKAKGARATKSR